jgi:hypothetical protein
MAFEYLSTRIKIYSIDQRNVALAATSRRVCARANRRFTDYSFSFLYPSFFRKVKKWKKNLRNGFFVRTSFALPADNVGTLSLYILHVLRAEHLLLLALVSHCYLLELLNKRINASRKTRLSLATRRRNGDGLLVKKIIIKKAIIAHVRARD